MKRQTLILVAAAALAVVVLAIVIPLIVKKDGGTKKDHDDSVPMALPLDTTPPLPTSAPTTLRYHSLLDWLTEILPENLRDGLVQVEGAPMTTPQLQAVQWLADEDGHAVDLSDHPSDIRKILQRYALAVYYYSMGGNRWEECSERSREYCKWTVPDRAPWLSPVDECDWAFLGCNAYGTLVEIKVESHGSGLYGNLMAGTLPKEMTLFTSLQTFDVAINVMKGDLDVALSGITSLVSIHVPENQLSGTFPNDLLHNNPNLEVLDLADNENIYGSVEGLVDHPTLQVLNLAWTGVTGIEPQDENSNTTSVLQELNLEGTKLSGTIPSLIANLAQLQVLTLDHTTLSGSIPHWVSQLSALQTLSLGQSNLQGSLPSELFDIASLQELRLPEAAFSGSLPAQGLANLTQLVHLDLTSNQFSGTIPETIRALTTSLRSLILTDNAFTGRIPEALEHLSVLETLELSQNDLTGSISSGVCAKRGIRPGFISALVVDCVVYCTCCDNCIGPF